MGAAHLDRGSERVERGSGRGRDQQLGAAGGLVPGGVRVEHDLRRPGGPGAQRLRGRHVAHAQHQPGNVAARKGLDPEQHVVVGHDVGAVVRPAAHSGGGLGEQRPAAGGGQPGGGLGDVLRGRAADDRAARLGGDAGGQLLHVVGVRGGGVLAQLGPRTAVGAAGPVGGVERLGLRGERLAQREVEMHRAGAAAGGGRVGPAGERAVVDGGLATGLVGAHLDEPLGRVAVELELVDRLAGADLAQLGRAVGGQHDQRNARLPRLDHGRMEVGRGGARGAGDRHRTPGRLGHSEREEARAALVEDGHGVELRPLREREHERSVARTGTRDRVAQPAPDQLVDERLNRRVGPVDRLHGARRYRGGHPTSRIWCIE